MKRLQHQETLAGTAIGPERSQSRVGLSRPSSAEHTPREAESGVFAAALCARGITLEQLDLASSVIWVAGEPIYLRPMERRLISLLVASANRVVMTEDVVANLYGGISLDAGRVRLKRLVADIRKRLGETFSRDLRTIHRVGLVLFVAEDGQAPDLNLVD
jgi:DNA-binding response OmpR family regulator